MESLLEDLENWKDQHKKFQKIFNNAVFDTPEYYSRRLNGLMDISAKHYYSIGNESKAVLEMIKIESKLLLDKINNGIKEGWRSQFWRFVRFQFKLNKYKKERKNNTQAEIKSFSPTLIKKDESEQRINRGKKVFTPAFNHRVSENERMDLKIFQIRSQEGKIYNIYKIKIKSEDQPNDIKEYSFSLKKDTAITEEMAYKLICGRSFLLEDGTWIKLDLNDKNELGHHTVLNILGVEKAIDIQDVIRKLPTKNLLDETEVSRIYNDLCKGEKPIISVLHNGKEKDIQLEFDPLATRLRTLDLKGNEVRISIFKEAQVVQLNTQKQVSARANRHSVKPS